MLFALQGIKHYGTLHKVTGKKYQQRCGAMQSVTRPSFPSLWVLQILIWHVSGLLTTWRRTHIRWHGGDSHLFHADFPLVSHKARCWVYFCSIFLGEVFTLVFILLLRRWYSSHYLLPTLIFQCGSQHVWQTSHQAWQLINKTELLFIPGDVSPCQDLVISYDNSQILPSVTEHNLGITRNSQVSFLPHSSVLVYSYWFT